MKLLSVLLSSLIAFPALAQVDDMSATVYLETTENTNLYLRGRQKDGSVLLIPRLALPTTAIISLSTEDLAKVTRAQALNPETVNYVFRAKSNGRSVNVKSKNGWMCGLSIVDAADEDIRETSAADRQDYCVSLATLAAMKPLAANGDEVKDAFNQWTVKKDGASLSQLAGDLFRQSLGEINNVQPLAENDRRVSPIRGCASGCLVVTSNFGYRYHPVLHYRRLHKGTDLRARTGTPVVSYADGRILANRAERAGKRLKGYGYYVIVAHPKIRMQTLYAHLSQFKGVPGQAVRAGDLIALSGNTGIGTAAHLHFETHVGGKKANSGYRPVDARTYLKQFLGRVAMWLESAGLIFG